MNTVEKELFLEEAFQGRNTQQQYYSSRNKYGATGTEQKKDKKIVGEYIDFEEIE